MVIDNKGTSISFLFSNLNEMKDFINLICSWNCRYHLAFLKLFILKKERCKCSTWKQDFGMRRAVLNWKDVEKFQKNIGSFKANTNKNLSGSGIRHMANSSSFWTGKCEKTVFLFVNEYSSYSISSITKKVNKVWEYSKDHWKSNQLLKLFYFSYSIF